MRCGVQGTKWRRVLPFTLFPHLGVRAERGSDRCWGRGAAAAREGRGFLSGGLGCGGGQAPGLPCGFSWGVRDVGPCAPHGGGVGGGLLTPSRGARRRACRGFWNVQTARGFRRRLPPALHLTGDRHHHLILRRVYHAFPARLFGS